MVARAVLVKDDRRPGTGARERALEAHALAICEWPVQTEPEPSGNARGQLVRRPLGDDPSAVQDADPVRQSLDVGQVVAGHEDRHTTVTQVCDDRPGRGPRLRVHARGGFVKDDHLRPPDERQRKTEPLSLAAGQPTVASFRHRAKADEVKEFVGVARVRVEATVLLERLARLGSRVDAAVLQHQADACAEGWAACGRIDAEDPGAATIRATVTLDDLHGRRLARAVGAEQCE